MQIAQASSEMSTSKVQRLAGRRSPGSGRAAGCVWDAEVRLMCEVVRLLKSLLRKADPSQVDRQDSSTNCEGYGGETGPRGAQGSLAGCLETAQWKRRPRCRRQSALAHRREGRYGPGGEGVADPREMLAMAASAALSARLDSRFSGSKVEAWYIAWRRVGVSTEVGRMAHLIMDAIPYDLPRRVGWTWHPRRWRSA